jgi:hypothetical protein
METIDSLATIRSKVKELGRLAQELYDATEDFPAINRNAKRVLASVEMALIGVEDPSHPGGERI